MSNNLYVDNAISTLESKGFYVAKPQPISTAPQVENYEVLAYTGYSWVTAEYTYLIATDGMAYMYQDGIGRLPIDPDKGLWMPIPTVQNSVTTITN